MVLLILQPFIGLIQHLRYKKTRERGIWTVVHRWYGRALILLGMINGGLGLRLANDTIGGKIAYGVVAGVSGSSLLGLIIWSERKDRKSHVSKAEAAAQGIDNEPMRSA